VSGQAHERNPHTPNANAPAEADRAAASDELEPIWAQRIRRARETTAALERISQEATPAIAALHELHASHLREAGDEKTAVRADARAERTKQLPAAQFDPPSRPELSLTLAAANNRPGLGASKNASPRKASRGEAGEATQVQRAVAGTQRAAAALQRAVEGSQRANAYEARAPAARERSAAARRRLQSAKGRSTASKLRSPTGERRSRTGWSQRIADERDRIADEREQINSVAGTCPARRCSRRSAAPRRSFRRTRAGPSARGLQASRRRPLLERLQAARAPVRPRAA
jgi:hypothetical protein